MFKAPDEGNYRSCRRDAPQEEQAFDIVYEVRQSDLRRRSRDPDGPDEQTHPILLLQGNDVASLRYAITVTRNTQGASLLAEFGKSRLPKESVLHQ